MRTLNVALKNLLDHPRTVVVLLMGSYLGIAAAGLFRIASPHILDVTDLYRYPAVASAYLAMLGGVLGAASIPCGIWWLERGAISVMVGSILVRMYSLTYQYAQGATPWSEAAISIAFLASIVLGMLVRLIYIRGLALDPKV